jgi:enoyl-CoA hydratase/carnithine racemase
VERVSGARFRKLLASPFAGDELGLEPRALVVDWSDGVEPSAGLPPPPPPATAPVVVIGIAPPSVEADVSSFCDVLVPDGPSAEEVVTAVEAQAIAATALVMLLRRAATTSIVDDIVAESATYSALQAGEAHRRWLARRPLRRDVRRDRPVVDVARQADRLDVVLVRPERRNAFSAQMRDDLLAAFAVAVADPSISQVHWRGDGPAFCSGGDLDEFGTGTDSGANHVLRLTRSVALALVAIADRVTVEVHGPCVGAGVELPAFAGRIVATPDATFRLPELGMGLIPGAGGTASLPRRIGRHRTAWLALTGRTIDARTAHRWGLVDVLAALGAPLEDEQRQPRSH